MTPLRHVMILASAGSGKTFALTSRFVELLARGAAPEKIVALTFTRKAAGEFFDEILNKLARAAAEPAAAAELARAIGAPHLGAPDFLRMLRAVVDRMPRLRLGTLDGFFARIARVFPFELGLTGEFELLEEYAARHERQRVLRRMFTRAGELDAAQKEFIEAFKRATFGADEKQLGPKLDAFLDAHQERYLEAREGALWGEAARIWPHGSVWLAANVEVRAATGVLREWAARAAPGDKQRERWQAFLAAAAAWAPGITPPRELAYVLEKALEAWPELTAGRAVLEFDRKKQELPADACAALADLTRHIVGGELSRRLATTRGIHAVLRGYEQVYHEAVRRAGKLTFADVQRLLVPGGSVGPLTREAADESRLFIDYRLDAGIDHWLLDEFQDTSRGQWSVLENLVDEVVQDPSVTRSFFCVGDVKQAIFTWREGDPRLFREIFHRYNATSPGTIVEQHLDSSWRSGPALIEMVNAVFGDAPAISGLFPGAAAEAWNREWRAHVSAVPQRNGQAALLLAEDEGQRWARVVELLNELRPLERGLTCAVLVPRNSTATELADYLRREANVPAVAESDLHVCTDNPLGAALLALAQAAAHPGDTLAWEHVQMTPLAAALKAEGIDTREAATVRLLEQIHRHGFERTMEFWWRRVQPHLGAGDGFSRTRARQFAAAAARFDQLGGRDVADFVQFMERHVVRDPESAAVVRVMTIHKSKGLGFDVVIVPDLEGKRLDERREGLAVQKASDRTVEWVLDLPPKLFYEADDVLTKHVRAAEAEAGYEALSLLYVALTRAKRAMYAIVQPVGKSTSRNYPRLLAETLGREAREVRIGGLSVPGTWMAGDPDWHRSLPPVGQAARVAGVEPQPLAGVAPAVRREARRPSAHASGHFPAGALFALEAKSGTAFGADVHRLLADIEWLAAGDIAALESRWRERGASEDAIEEAVGCLRAPDLAPLWRRPEERSDVWRERAFEVIRDSAWITGVFDRVVIVRDAAGRPVRANVIDYKTDRIDGEADVLLAVRRHAPQLALYADVVGVLTGLAQSAITTELVLTRSRRRLAVPRAAG